MQVAAFLESNGGEGFATRRQYLLDKAHPQHVPPHVAMVDLEDHMAQVRLFDRGS